VDVRKLLASVFQENDRLLEAKPTLEQTCLMHDVFAGTELTVWLLVLSSHNQQGKGSGIKYLGQPFSRGHTGRGHIAKFIERKMKPVDEEIL
jgi:hypothetical protein